MKKENWLAHNAEGVAAEADVQAYPSVRHVFDSAVARYRPKRAFTSMGTTLTYGDIDGLSRDFAGYLQNDLGMARGERLALMLPNVLQYPVALFGAFLAGLTIVNVNPQYTARELQQQLLHSGTRAIVVLENFAHTVQDVVTALPGVEDAAVIGVLDAMSGEAVKLLVVRKDANLQADAIAVHCRSSLPRTSAPSTSSSARSCQKHPSVSSCASRCVTIPRRRRI